MGDINENLGLDDDDVRELVEQTLAALVPLDEEVPAKPIARRHEALQGQFVFGETIPERSYAEPAEEYDPADPLEGVVQMLEKEGGDKKTLREMATTLFPALTSAEINTAVERASANIDAHPTLSLHPLPRASRPRGMNWRLDAQLAAAQPAPPRRRKRKKESKKARRKKREIRRALMSAPPLQFPHWMEAMGAAETAIAYRLTAERFPKDKKLAERAYVAEERAYKLRKWDDETAKEVVAYVGSGSLTERDIHDIVRYAGGQPYNIVLSALQRAGMIPPAGRAASGPRKGGKRKTRKRKRRKTKRRRRRRRSRK